MVIQARISHAQEVLGVLLPLHGIARQAVFPIFQCQHVLEDIDERLFPRQALLPIELEIAEVGIACFGERSRLTDRLKGPIHQIWLWLHPLDPAEDSRRAVAAIVPLLMSHVPLEIVVAHPLLMGGKQIFPAVRSFKAPVRHTPLDVDYVELILTHPTRPFLPLILPQANDVPFRISSITRPAELCHFRLRCQCYPPCCLQFFSGFIHRLDGNDQNRCLNDGIALGNATINGLWIDRTTVRVHQRVVKNWKRVDALAKDVLIKGLCTIHVLRWNFKCDFTHSRCTSFRGVESRGILTPSCTQRFSVVYTVCLLTWKYSAMEATDHPESVKLHNVMAALRRIRGGVPERKATHLDGGGPEANTVLIE